MTMPEAALRAFARPVEAAGYQRIGRHASWMRVRDELVLLAAFNVEEYADAPPGCVAVSTVGGVAAKPVLDYYGARPRDVEAVNLRSWNLRGYYLVGDATGPVGSDEVPVSLAGFEQDVRERLLPALEQAGDPDWLYESLKQEVMLRPEPSPDQCQQLLLMAATCGQVADAAAAGDRWMALHGDQEHVPGTPHHVLDEIMRIRRLYPELPLGPRVRAMLES